MRPRWSLAWLCALAGCGAGAGDTPEGPTWYGDVEPIVQQSCARCHRAGGIGPIVLDARGAPPAAFMMADKTAARIMPPWQPGPLSKPMQGERHLAQADIDTIAAWARAGAPLGDAALHRDRTPPEPLPGSTLGPPSRSIKLSAGYASSYAPRHDLEDDVRCFVVDLGLTENSWVTAVRWDIDTSAQVHHLGGGAIDAAETAKARMLDLEKDPDGVNHPGYDCPGGARVRYTAGFGANGGLDGVLYPEGTAVFVPAGAALLMSVHYSSRTTRVADDSGVSLWFTTRRDLRPLSPSVQVQGPSDLPCPAGVTMDAADPCSRAYALAHSSAAFSPDVVRWINDLAIRRCATSLDALWALPAAPGAAQYLLSRSCEGGLPYAGTLHTVHSHMHTRGHASRVEVVRGGVAEVLLDIPRWDWHWESDYVFLRGVEVAAGDRVRVSCSFDNGAAKQPYRPMVEGGQQEPPRYVVGSEGRYDEMCGGTLGITRALTRGQAWPSICAEARALYDDLCPGRTDVSTFLWSGSCGGLAEQRAVLLLATPLDAMQPWCDPEPTGAGATTGATCVETLQCATRCGLGESCLDGCRTSASLQGKYRFDAFMGCAAPWCDKATLPVTDWYTCSAVACSGVLQRCAR